MLSSNYFGNQSKPSNASNDNLTSSKAQATPAEKRIKQVCGLPLACEKQNTASILLPQELVKLGFYFKTTQSGGQCLVTPLFSATQRKMIYLSPSPSGTCSSDQGQFTTYEFAPQGSGGFLLTLYSNFGSETVVYFDPYARTGYYYEEKDNEITAKDESLFLVSHASFRTEENRLWHETGRNNVTDFYGFIHKWIYEYDSQSHNMKLKSGLGTGLKLQSKHNRYRLSWCYTNIAGRKALKACWFKIPARLLHQGLVEEIRPLGNELLQIHFKTTTITLGYLRGQWVQFTKENNASHGTVTQVKSLDTVLENIKWLLRAQTSCPAPALAAQTS